MLKICQNILSPLRNSAGRVNVTITSQRDVSKNVLNKLGLPPPPKRPPSAYNLFCKEQLPQLKLQHPDSKPSELIAMVSQLWKSVDESQKKALEEIRVSERQAYDKAKAAFQEVIKPHEVDILKAEKRELSQQSQKDLHKLGKPKRPANAYTLFVSSQKSTRGNLSVPEFAKVMGKKWKELAENEKQEYQKIYLNDVKVYEKKLKDWEKKMIAQGYGELISPALEKDHKKKQATKKV